MRIGEFFVENNHITKESLSKALEVQKNDNAKPIGDILVEIGAISKENLIKYVNDYINANLEEARQWLNQDTVDSMINKYTHLRDGD